MFTLSLSLTQALTHPWTERLLVMWQSVKKSPAFYRNRRVILVFTRACSCSLPKVK